LLKHLGINSKFTKFKINQNQIEMFQTNQRTNRKSENRKKEMEQKKKRETQPNWAAPGSQTGQQPSGRPAAQLPYLSPSLSPTGGSRLSDSSSPDFSPSLSVSGNGRRVTPQIHSLHAVIGHQT
jgi:hypothetical protein